MTLKFSIPWFSLCHIYTYVFSADPLLLQNPVPLERKQLLGSVLVFEQRTKTKTG